MIFRRLYLLVFCLAPLFGFSQVTITGSVLNMTDTKPVAGASVFLSNTTIGNETAANGTFTLYNVKPGKYDLVVTILGFENYAQSIVVGHQDIHLAPISLASTAILLNAVKIKGNNSWNRLYRDFKEQFLGTSDYAGQCKILNPDSLSLNYDPEVRQLTARSKGFLVIENKALGYRVKYLLTRFVDDYKEKSLSYKGYPIFEEMKGTDAEKAAWAKARLDCYNGSSMQFLRSVIKDKVPAYGFIVYKLVRRLNHAPLGFKDNDGLNTPDPELKFKYLERFTDTVLKTIDYFNGTSQPGIYAIDYPYCLYVQYKNRYDYTKSPVYTKFQMPNYQTTIVTLTQPYALFDDNGVFTDPSDVSYQGYWGTMRVAQLLPSDYEPN